MNTHAHWVVIEVTPTLVLIKDTGHNLSKSVTNDAEYVVQEVYKKYGNRRIDYIDSDGQRDQLVHTKGVFTGFAPGAMY